MGGDQRARVFAQLRHGPADARFAIEFGQKDVNKVVVQPVVEPEMCIRDRDINLILENIVYLELLRRGYEVTVGKIGGKEIDFVCDKRGEKLYVQVAYLLASEETIAREFGAYDPVRDNFPKYVVSLDEFDMSRNGIKHRNIRDFLLMDEWN